MTKPLQVLIVTMKRDDFSFLERINLQCDALVGNQGMPENAVSETEFRGHRVRMYSWNERGVGLNRNNLMMRADADIILFADDDVIYDEGYVDKVVSEFEKHPEADGITFNVIPIPDSIDPDLNVKWHRIRWYNCLKYGAPRLALRTKTLREKDVYYSLLFGGGAKYSSGEDSLFVAECLKRGMKLYASPHNIGHVTFDTSSWYTGFNDKYFMDKGLFFYFLSHRFARLLCLQYCVRKKALFKEACSPKEAYRLMMRGIAQYKKGQY